MTVIVHHLEDSRSQRVLWLLEELSVAYEVKRYNRDPVTRLAPPELLAIHPLGKSPVIEIDGAVFAETGAIFEALLDKFDSAHTLHPASDDSRYADHRFWLHYAEGSAMTPLLLKMITGRLGDAAAPAMGFIDAQIALHANYQESVVAKTGWLVGDNLTAADIIMSFPVEASATRSPIGDTFPALAAWVAKLHARPAYQAALKSGGPYSYA